jgi:transposase
MFVPVTVVGDQTAHDGSQSDVVNVITARVEIEIAGARMIVIGSVAPDLAQAMVAALRGGR